MRKIFNISALTLLLVCSLFACKEDDMEEIIQEDDIEIVENSFNITNNGAAAYVFDGGNLSGSENPNLTLKRGETYSFNISANGHPFLIKTAATTGTNNTFDLGVDNNGAESGEITFKVPATAPDELFYICQFHGGMTGTFIIVD